jgi:hypothetical protein
MPRSHAQRKAAKAACMNLRRASRLYLPPTIALTVLTGAPVALADWAEGPGTHVAAADPADAGTDAASDSGADAGEARSSTGCGDTSDLPSGAALIGAGCC